MMTLYNAIREVPKEAQKQFNNGRFKGTDINPMWRIQTLTEHFGQCGIGWYYEVGDKWSETGNGETCVFVEVNLYVKVDGEWSKPIYGIGGSKMVSNEKRGIYVNDEAYKMATTDAISVACKNLGMGADIYWASGNTKYSDSKRDEYQQELDEPISSSHVNILKEKCSAVGLAYDAVARRFGKTNLEELTEADYGTAINGIAKMQEQAK